MSSALPLLRRRIARNVHSLLGARAISHIHPRAYSHATSSVPDNEVVGPGSKDPELIATDYEQAAGMERIELLSKLAGKSAFLMEPLKVDHFGTLKDPIVVDSVVGRRLVGCTGFPKGSHDLLYFWVDETEGPARCRDCGQAFRINKLH